jgi:hypothetical protein
MKQLLSVLALVCIFPNVAFSAPARESMPPLDVKAIVLTENIAKEAYLWGYPFVKFERTKRLLTTTPGFGHAPLNTFFHADRLPTAQDRGVANPLPDTLYSSAFLDLRQQPMVFQLPKITDRYYSVQFMDANSNIVGLVSSRTRGSSAGKFFITGPHFIGSTPEGFEHIRSSTNFVWVTGHMGADSPSQVREANLLLKKYELRPYSAFISKEKMPKTVALTGRATTADDPRRLFEAGVGFFDELGEALKVNEPSNLEPAVMDRFQSIDVAADVKTSQKAAAREIREAYVRAIASGEIEIDQTIKKELVVRKNGWNYITRGDDFAKNYTLRAAMSKIYFGETNSSEAIHPVAYFDRDGARLHGNSTYILRFAKDKMPPASAFWSAVSYHSKEKSLVANNLNRYSLGSYSKNLLLNPDGSLDLYISANEPTGHTTNWIPAPRGNFYVMMNLYNPSTDVISGKFTLPGIQKITLSPILSLNK